VCYKNGGAILCKSTGRIRKLFLQPLQQTCENRMGNQADTDKPYVHLTDRELVAACLDNDAKAWETLILRYQRLIYSIPAKQGFSSVDAADVFQSVCLILLKKLPTLRKQEKLFSWLMTTTTRECWRVAAQWRREGTVETRDPNDPFDKLSEVASQEPLAEEQRIVLEQQQILREAIERLPERCRQLISLLFYQTDELSYAEIAARLKIPVSSMGANRARCLQKLKKDLEKKI
jgi:RNA polymerase sigma factor (sigma-70 family)